MDWNRFVKGVRWWVFGFMILGISCHRSPHLTNMSSPYIGEGIQKLRYNHPGLLVDLDVGFKSVPIPMDFDGDGDIDLLVSATGSYVECGVFYFENISGNVANPIFRAGEKLSFDRFRLGYEGVCFVDSKIGDQHHVITPDRVNDRLLIYEDVPQHVFWKKRDMPESIQKYVPKEKSTWKMADFDLDGKYDLLSAQSTSNGEVLLFYKNTGENENPYYQSPIHIRTETVVLEPGEKSVDLTMPLADYDNDGDLDYFGTTRYSKLVYFENKDAATSYRFEPGVTLDDQGKDMQFISRSTIHLRAVDLDQDGWIDLVAGDEDGKVSFLRNTGQKQKGRPKFLPPVYLQQEAKYVDLGSLVAPRIYDWDGDGRKDIVAGNGLGHLIFVKNLGGEYPRWDQPELLAIDGVPIRIIPSKSKSGTSRPYWGYVTIDVGDWDHDGLSDIVANDHNGNVRWFKNVGSRKNPQLSEAQPIEVKWKGAPLKPNWVPGWSTGNELLAPWRTIPYIMDFNGDQMNDLVMMDHEGYLAVYPRSKEESNWILNHPERNFIYEDGRPVQINQLINKSSGRLKFDFADWDNDGRQDLILASKPAVDWMKNMGMKDGKMVLKYMGRMVSKTMMGHTDAPVVSDINQDGISDLWVGTETGVIYVWQRPNSKVTTTMTTTGPQSPAKYPYFKR